MATKVRVVCALLIGWAPALALGEEPKGIAGAWEGKLKVGPTELRIVLRVSEGDGGKLEAKLDSPDQGARGIPVDAIAVDQGKVRLTMKGIGASYEGTLNEAETEIVGEWKQLGPALPLVLKRTGKPSEVRRPQEPRKPYPYREETVRYTNEAGGVTMEGTLTIPKGDGPFPSAILITGSGPQDRDESLLGHKPFLVLADHLTRRGIAVLRVDDRGVGGSTGNTMKATSEDVAGDVLAGVAFLKGRPEIARDQIGLIGHSEGGLIAPMVAARSQDIAYIVLMAGTGLTGEEILLMQGALIARSFGASKEDLARQRDLQRRIFEIYKAEEDEKAAGDKIRAILRERLASLSDTEKQALGGDPDRFIEGQIQQLQSPWFRYFLTHDPRPALREVRCPVLAINGEKDLQVPPKENLAAIEEALKAGGNSRYTVKELPGLNHLFQPSKTGSLTEYAQIEETIAPSALTLISDWILQQVGDHP